MDDDTPYVISGSKVRLSPLAQEMARTYWPDLPPMQANAKMARHFLRQNDLREIGLTQKTGEN